MVQVERARQALARLKDDMAGPVRMTVPVSLGETFFDGLLLEFSAQYPEVQIELELSNNYRDLSRDGFDWRSAPMWPLTSAWWRARCWRGGN